MNSLPIGPRPDTDLQHVPYSGATIFQPSQAHVDDLELWFVKDFKSILRRHWRILVIVPLIVALATLGWCLAAKPQYEVTTTLLLQNEQQSQSQSLLAAAGVMNGLPSMNDMSTQMEVMTSDDVLSGVIEQLGLKETTGKLRSQITLSQDKNSNAVMDVAVRAPRAVLAEDIITALVDVYRRNVGAEDATVVGQSAKLVRVQIATAASSLKQAEDALAGYSATTGTIEPTAAEEKRVEMLYALKAESEDARQKLAADKAESSYYAAQLGAMPQSIVSNLSFERNPDIDSTQQQLSGLEAQRASLATEYTAQDDQMIQNQNEIDALKQQIAAARKAQDSTAALGLGGGGPDKTAPGYFNASGTRELNPIRQDAVQRVVNSLADADAQTAGIAAAQTALTQITAQYGSVPATIRKTVDLTDDVEVARKTYDSLRLQLSQLEAQRGESQLYVKTLVSPILPKKPAFPRPLLFTAAAFLCALVAAAISVLVVEATSSRVRGPFDISTQVPLPQLTVLPMLGVQQKSQRVVSEAGRSAAIRRLANTLVYKGLGTTIRSLLVTSAVSGEGVSFTTSELALALSLEGKRVIIVDANLRSPNLHTFFGLSNTYGLAGAMRNGAQPEKALLPVSGRALLHLVPGGSLEDESFTQLFDPEKLELLIEALRSRADIVLLDAPAIFQGFETATLARGADACLIVTALGIPERDELRRAVELLSGCNTNLMGVVVNEGAAPVLRDGKGAGKLS